MKKMICGGIMALMFSVAVTNADAQLTTHSRARKNTAIGAGAGAVTGAMVSRSGHKGKGAILGGVVGGVAGYAWGKHQDRKKGRKVVYKH
jgi:outer membrane lipoprotein SlyB